MAIKKSKKNTVKKVKKTASKKKVSAKKAAPKKKVLAKKKVSAKKASPKKKVLAKKKVSAKKSVAKKKVAVAKNKPVKTAAKKIKQPVAETLIPQVIPVGEDMHFIPQQGEALPLTPVQAHQAENTFHNKEEVALHQENKKIKDAFAIRKNPKNIYRRGRRS